MFAARRVAMSITFDPTLAGSPDAKQPTLGEELIALRISTRSIISGSRRSGAQGRS
jgi:hypothetical protein